MTLNELYKNDRAVSPVVGVALLIAMTVILAAVIGAVVLGLGTGGVETPQAQLQAEYDSTADEWTISHNGGEAIPAAETEIINANGGVEDSANFPGDELTAGDSYTFSSTADEIQLLWDDPNSQSETILEVFEA